MLDEPVQAKLGLWIERLVQQIEAVNGEDVGRETAVLFVPLALYHQVDQLFQYDADLGPVRFIADLEIGHPVEVEQVVSVGGDQVQGERIHFEGRSDRAPAAARPRTAREAVILAAGCTAGSPTSLPDWGAAGINADLGWRRAMGSVPGFRLSRFLPT